MPEPEKIVPYDNNKALSAKGPTRAFTINLSDGRRVQVAKYLEREGCYFEFLGPTQDDGTRTQLEFALTDEACAALRACLDAVAIAFPPKVLVSFHEFKESPDA